MKLVVVSCGRTTSPERRKHAPPADRGLQRRSDRSSIKRPLRTFCQRLPLEDTPSNSGIPLSGKQTGGADQARIRITSKKLRYVGDQRAEESSR